MWNSRSGTHWGSASFSDYWPRNASNGADSWNVTYSARIQCYGPDAAGDWSGTASASIRIDQPAIPVPAAPTSIGADGNWVRYCGNTGFQGKVAWGASANATSHTVQYRFLTKDGSDSGWITYGSTSSTNMVIGVIADTVTNANPRVRVSASGPGGSSGWSAEAGITLQLGCF